VDTRKINSWATASDIQTLRGVFSHTNKQRMIERRYRSDCPAVEGEAMRGVTWVRVKEFASGEWPIGGKALTTADVKSSFSPTLAKTRHLRLHYEWRRKPF